MMKKLPWVLLAVSIIFNFTFTGGFLRARSEYQVAKAPGDAAEMVADEFNLTEDQRKVFAQLREQARAETKDMRQSLLLARQDLLSEISSASPDPQRVREIQDRLAELYCEFRSQSSEHLRQFLDHLSPEQRKAVMDKIRQRDRSHRWGRHLLERFDTNRDGKLDESERSRARKYFAGRHDWSPGRFPHRRSPWPPTPPGAPRRPQGGPRTRPAPRGPWSPEARKRMLERFDTDGDGTISSDEWARARQAFEAARSPRRTPQWMLDRFDADRDGNLSPSERAAAAKALKKGPPRPTERRQP